MVKTEQLCKNKKSSKHWLMSGDRLSFVSNSETILPAATEIVRIEFKGQDELYGKKVNKPSDDLPSIKFSRFPGRVYLELETPINSFEKPKLGLFISIENETFQLSELPREDQLVTGGIWVPIVQETVDEIREILAACGIDNLGFLTLRQYFDLIRDNSHYIRYKDTAEKGLVISESDDSLALIGEINRNGFDAELYPYQKTGVSWLNSMARENIGCILADEMGLGKTIQIIALITLFKNIHNSPSMIVAPATLLENWRREFSKFSSGIKVLVHSGYKRTGFPSKIEKYDVIITSYDILVRDLSMFGLVPLGFVILDEAQAIKNSETKRAISVKKLSKIIGIAVTGTPVENKLLDLWSLMDFACPGFFGKKENFETSFVDDIDGAEKLEKIITPLILRRKVADVASDLPEKIIIPQVVELCEESINSYEQLRETIFSEYGDSATLVSLIRLRQFCTHPFLLNSELKNPAEKYSNKYQRLLEILDEIVSKKEKAIVFTSFTSMSDLLVFDLPIRFGIEAFQIDGRTDISDRQLIIDNFSLVSGSAFLILNPKAAGTGLNITAANHVIHYNLEWNPATEDQATARAYRRGQKLPVTVHRLFYANTIEDVINDRIERKRAIAEAAIIGSDAEEIDKADVARVLRLSPK